MHLRLRGTPADGVLGHAHRHIYNSSEGGGVREHNLCSISGSNGPARRDLEGMPRQSLARLNKTLSTKRLFKEVSPHTHSPELKVVPFKPIGKTATLSTSYVRGSSLCLDSLSLEAPTHPQPV